MLLKTGLQELVIREATVAAGTTIKDISVQSDAVLALLWINSISGSLTLTVYGILDNGKQIPVVELVPATTPTPIIIQKRSGLVPTRLRVVASYTGAVNYEVSLRAINAGIVDTRVVGAGTLTVQQNNVNHVPKVLIAASNSDRSAIAIKNWSTSGTIYIGESISKTNQAKGWPIGPKDALGLDIQAGVTIYAVSDGAVCDIRIIESGG